MRSIAWAAVASAWLAWAAAPSLGRAAAQAPSPVRLSPEKVLFFETHGYYLNAGIARFAAGAPPEEVRRVLQSHAVTPGESASGFFNLWRFTVPPDRSLLETLSRVAGDEKVLYVLPITDLQAVAKSPSSQTPLEVPGRVGVKFKTLRTGADASAIEAIAREAGAVVEWSPRESTVMLRFRPVQARTAEVIAFLEARAEVYGVQADKVSGGYATAGDPGASEDYRDDPHDHYRYRGRHYHHDY